MVITIYPNDMIRPSEAIRWNTLVGTGVVQREISDPVSERILKIEDLLKRAADIQGVA